MWDAHRGRVFPFPREPRGSRRVDLEFELVELSRKHLEPGAELVSFEFDDLPQARRKTDRPPKRPNRSRVNLVLAAATVQPGQANFAVWLPTFDLKQAGCRSQQVCRRKARLSCIRSPGIDHLRAELFAELSLNMKNRWSNRTLDGNETVVQFLRVFEWHQAAIWSPPLKQRHRLGRSPVLVDHA